MLFDDGLELNYSRNFDDYRCYKIEVSKYELKKSIEKQKQKNKMNK